MAQQSAYGSVTIKRLRTGETIYMSFSVNKPLVVFYNESGIITDWNSSANQPTIIPNVTSMTGSLVSTQDFRWTKDGTEIQFNAGSGTVTSKDGKFKLNTANGALTIIDADIYGATPHNVNLMFKCNAIVSNISQEVSKPVEISVLSGGSNSYWGAIITDNGTTLNEDRKSITLGAMLLMGGNPVSEPYTYKWSKVTASGNTPIGTTGQPLVVNRDMVDGSTQFQCDFYLGTSAAGDIVEADGVTVIDTADELTVIVPSDAEVGYGKEVQIRPKLWNTNKNAEVTSGVTWSVVVKDSLSYQTIPSSKYAFSSGVFTMREDEMYNSNGEEINPVVIFEATI